MWRSYTILLIGVTPTAGSSPMLRGHPCSQARAISGPRYPNSPLGLVFSYASSALSASRILRAPIGSLSPNAPTSVAANCSRSSSVRNSPRTTSLPCERTTRRLERGAAGPIDVNPSPRPGKPPLAPRPRSLLLDLDDICTHRHDLDRRSGQGVDIKRDAQHRDFPPGKRKYGPEPHDGQHPGYRQAVGRDAEVDDLRLLPRQRTVWPNDDAPYGALFDPGGKHARPGSPPHPEKGDQCYSRLLRPRNKRTH